MQTLKLVDMKTKNCTFGVIFYLKKQKTTAWVKQEEERLLAIRKSEENAKQSTEHAERAKEELERLRGR